MSLPAHLHAAYCDAVYEVDFASGRRAFRHGQRAAPCPAFAIVTAWHPGTARPSQAENEAANERLASVLDAEGYCYVTARGYSPDHTHEEPSFAILGIELEEALVLASTFGQAAIFWWDGEAGRVILTADAAE